MIFRTVFREPLTSRQIALIDFPCTKNARRIFAIVSTISIPISAPMNHGSHCGPSAPGSRLDADHPEKGVLIPRRFTQERRGCPAEGLEGQVQRLPILRREEQGA